MNQQQQKKYFTKVFNITLDRQTEIMSLELEDNYSFVCEPWEDVPTGIVWHKENNGSLIQITSDDDPIMLYVDRDTGDVKFPLSYIHRTIKKDQRRDR